MTTYDAVLFDNDGVLVEPPGRETQLEAIRSAFGSFDVEAVDERHVRAVVSGVSVDTLHEVCSAYDLDVEAFWAAREDHDERSQFEAFRAGSRGRYDDVTAIEDLEVPCGVVSNNHHSTVEFVLEFFELDPLFDTYHGRPKTVESLRLKKPNTHYLDRAVAELDVGSALYVGDSASDVVAAHRAGMDSAFVRREHCADVTHETPPTYEVETLHELLDLVDD
ncbi:HAD family hydrolase [Haloarchaeobius sp. HRN-SO-5]|uniref:HAD family hydrolase n=1 Tax=Haloarchaeobius sp. HRN-SO-5 TaxID=3446118 RepID=UPI003EBD466D